MTLKEIQSEIDTLTPLKPSLRNRDEFPMDDPTRRKRFFGRYASWNTRLRILKRAMLRDDVNFLNPSADMREIELAEMLQRPKTTDDIGYTAQIIQDSSGGQTAKYINAIINGAPFSV